MFGKNPIRSQELDPLGTIRLTEAFYTLQGEGPFSGCPALFIRLAGCNLACTFCDTEFEKGIDQPHSPAYVVADLAARFTRAQRKLVVLTGGEPLRQNILPLLDNLYANGTEHVQIETAGTLWVPGLDDFLKDGEKMTIVCSPKTPRVHIEIAAHCNHWKYIVRASDARDCDGLPFSGTQAATIGKPSRLYRPDMELIEDRGDTIWLSPCDECDEAKNFANMSLATRLCLEHGYRLSLQTHKIIGVA